MFSPFLVLMGHRSEVEVLKILRIFKNGCARHVGLFLSAYVGL